MGDRCGDSAGQRGSDVRTSRPRSSYRFGDERGQLHPHIEHMKGVVLETIRSVQKDGHDCLDCFQVFARSARDVDEVKNVMNGMLIVARLYSNDA